MRTTFIEPQDTEQGIMNVEVRKSEKYFLLRHSLFDIQYSILSQQTDCLKEIGNNYF